MRVKKRDGNFQEVSFDKVINRLKSLCEMKPELPNIDVTEIAIKSMFKNLRWSFYKRT